METNGFKNRLEEAKQNSEYIKIIFQYPNAQRATIKRGYVKNCYDDSFDFNERFDGHVTYSYEFIVEISSGNEGGNK